LSIASKASKAGWHRTSPLAAIFYIGRIIEVVTKNAVQTLAPLVALSFAYQGDLKDKVVFGAIAIVTITLATAILRYLFFRFQITDDSVLIREGVVMKRQLDIKFDRIQAINTEQNFIYRFFNIVTVKFDTAGSSGQEGNLPAVKPELAAALRERINRKKSHDRAEGSTTEVEDIPPLQSRTLLTLSNTDMVRIGLSDNRALIFLAVLGPFVQQMEARIEEFFDEFTVLAGIAGQTGIAKAFSFFLLFSVVVFGLLAIASISGAFLRFYRYQLVENDAVFQSTGGLLTRHIHSVNRGKIQTVVATQNLMLRMFGRFRINARQASSGKQRSTKDFTVPVCMPNEMESLAGEFFADEYPGLTSDPRSSAFSSIAFQFMRSRTLLTALLPAAIVCTVFATVIGWYALLFLFWIPLITLINWQLYRRYGVHITQDGLALRRGFVGFRITSFLYRKVQRVGVTQTFFQRRKGLATLRFFLASGTIKVPYVDYEKAMRLRDYVLFKVESSNRAWH